MGVYKDLADYYFSIGDLSNWTIYNTLAESEKNGDDEPKNDEKLHEKEQKKQNAIEEAEEKRRAENSNSQKNVVKKAETSQKSATQKNEQKAIPCKILKNTNDFEIDLNRKYSIVRKNSDSQNENVKEFLQLNDKNGKTIGYAIVGEEMSYFSLYQPNFDKNGNLTDCKKIDAKVIANNYLDIEGYEIDGKKVFLDKKIQTKKYPLENEKIIDGQDNFFVDKLDHIYRDGQHCTKQYIVPTSLALKRVAEKEKNYASHVGPKVVGQCSDCLDNKSKFCVNDANGNFVCLLVSWQEINKTTGAEFIDIYKPVVDENNNIRFYEKANATLIRDMFGNIKGLSVGNKNIPLDKKIGLKDKTRNKKLNDDQMEL